MRAVIGGRMTGSWEKSLNHRITKEFKIPTLSQKTRQGWGTLLEFGLGYAFFHGVFQ